MPKKKRPRGRPATRVMPEMIPDSAANVVRALCQGPPKREWDFQQPDGAGYVRERPPGRPPREADLDPLVLEEEEGRNQ